jgi:hypothetical protein
MAIEIGIYISWRPFSMKMLRKMKVDLATVNPFLNPLISNDISNIKSIKGII